MYIDDLRREHAAKRREVEELYNTGQITETEYHHLLAQWDDPVAVRAREAREQERIAYRAAIKRRR